MRERLVTICFFVFLLSFIMTTAPVQAADSSSEEIHYTILLKDPGKSQAFLSQLHKHVIKVTYQVKQVGLFQVEANSAAMEKLARDGDYIDRYNPSLVLGKKEVLQTSHNISLVKRAASGQIAPLWDGQWDMQKVTENGLSYGLSEGSKQSVVGIIDSGIDRDHPDLKGNLLSVENFVPKGGLRGTEPAETGDKDFNPDILGHGTFVAGQIAANGMIKGIAPETGIRSYRVFGSKSADSCWVIKAIIQAADDDVDVINLSLNTYLVKGKIINEKGLPETGERAEIKAFQKSVSYAHKKGSIVVSSLGNEGLDMSDEESAYAYWKKNLSGTYRSFYGRLMSVPAQLPHTVSVSSVGPTKELSLFSNYGQHLVDVASYGGDMRLFQQYDPETYFNKGIFLQEFILGAAPGGTYTYTVGNSIAVPKVSGTLVLLIDRLHLHNRPDKVIKMLKTDEGRGRKAEVGKGVVNTYRTLKEPFEK